MSASDVGRSQRQAAVVGFVLAVIVLVAGIAAALTKDDDNTGQRTSTGLSSTTTSVTSSSSSSSSSATSSTTVTTATGSSTTLATLPGSGTTTTRPGTTTTTAPPFSHDDAEKAANGLFAAYRAGDQQAAAKYATPAVVSGLFAQPVQVVSFGGCTQDGQLYQCRFASADAAYNFTVQADPKSGAAIVVIFSYQGPAVSTTTSSSG